jgi:hypothetical protein
MCTKPTKTRKFEIANTIKGTAFLALIYELRLFKVNVDNSLKAVIESVEILR